MLTASIVQIVRKTQFPWIIAVILVAGYAGWHLLGLILTALGLSVAYFSSLRVHPRMRHGKCSGTGEHRGSVFTWVHRKCPRCQGGRIIRYGAGHWGAGQIQAEYAKGRQARKTAKENRKWR